MQRKNKFKLVTFAMLLALFPSMNFGAVSEAFSSGHVKQASLGKVFSPQEVSATTPKTNMLVKSNVPTGSYAFTAVSIPQPSRPALAMKLPGEALNGNSFGYQSSIAGLADVAAGRITVIKNGVSVQAYTTVNDTNVRAALQYIYDNADNTADFVLFVGGNVTLTAATTANTTTGGTFASLKGKAKSLTVVSNVADGTTGTTYTITTPANNYFGTPTVFRNVNVSGSNDFYAQGNAIAFMPGSNFTSSPNIYGGTDGNSNVSGDTNIYVAATGSGTMSFYGGNKTGGNISGDTHVSIVNASGLGTVTGGNASGGVISGNTNVSVTGFTGNVASSSSAYMTGAGIGTSASPVTVNGDVLNNWNSTIAGARYDGTYYGGAIYGTVKGTIYNTFKGLGAYNDREAFNGGSQNGSIGVSSYTGTSIINEYDTSAFTGGGDDFASFAGISGANNNLTGGDSNNRQMTTYGNIISYVKTGYGGSTAYIGGAAGAYGSDYEGSRKMPASGTSVDANPTAAAATAETSADAKLFGDSYIWLQAGLVGAGGGGGGGGADYNIVLGAGYGFIKGNSVMEVGDGSTAPGGNTTGENGVIDGSRSSSNRIGIGGAGFVSIGDSGNGAAARTIATNGLSYNGADTNLANSYYLNDIVGGGGSDSGNGSNYWQVGDTYLIQNNSAARWTYGAGWSGNIVGNTYNFNNGAVTDTLEGGMYGSGGNVYGNTNAQFNNGQTDWFLSGGAWNGRYISGNMTTIVNKGVIPANTGGNYALNGNNITKGNSSVYIYGGDFSNAPRQDGPKRVCGGNFNSGGSYVYGDSSLTLDLTGPNGNTFEFPAGNTYLSAGAGYERTGVTTGTDASNSINLTIKANAATATKLSSAVIYGDGSDSANTKAGTINITIDADGATVGNVYASRNTLISSNALTRNVVTKIGEGTTIGGNVLNSGQSDNLTSAIANNANSKTSTIQFGDGSGDITNPIKITGKISNFTSAEVMSGINTTVSGGLLNGANATAGNHAATYAKSGDLKLHDNSTLAVSTTTSVISAGKLTVGKDVQLSSPYTNAVGLMNFSDLDMSESGARLSWIPTGTPPSTITNTYGGAYWGSQKGFPVLTFNGGTAAQGSGAFNLTPGNFQGIDAANNYAFLGDYTINSVTSPSNPSWIGYVVPGQIRVFNTTGLNGSTGNWQYDLPGVTTGTPTPGVTMQAWSSATPNTPTSSFELKYTMNYNPTLSGAQPFSFDSDTPGYIKSRSASAYNGNVINNYPTTNPNFGINAGTTGATRHFATKDYFTGNRQDGTNDQANFGSYIIQNVVTDNTTSLNAGNYILPTTDAATLTQAQLQQLAGLRGVGVMSDITVNSGILSTINTAGSTVQNPTSAATNVAGQAYANIPMTWHLGSSTADTNIVVVPQAAVISADHQTAVNAYDTGMTGDDANDLNDQADLDNNWTYARGFKADGTVEAPTITVPIDLVTKLQTITSGDPLIDPNTDNIDPVTYSYNGVSKNIVINLTFGFISLTTPTAYDFGTLNVRPTPLVAWAQTPSSDVIVEDTRTGRGLQPWYVTVKQSTDLQGTTNGNNISPYLIFKNGATSKQITSAALQVYANTAPTTGTFNLNQNWNANTGEGIHLNIPVQSQIKGVYEGELTWTLNDTPTN